jgi:hypothetical protein
MTIHLSKFIERVQGQQARGARDFIMSLKDAQDLHADITRLLLELQTLREHTVQTLQKDNEVITVNMNGGTF